MISNRRLDQILAESPSVNSDENVEAVLDDGEKSRQLINTLENIVKSLPNHLVASQQLNKDNENAIKDNTQSKNQRKMNIYLITVFNITTYL